MSASGSYPIDSDSIFLCNVCGEQFDNDEDHIPRVLRCGHTFTSNCLVKLMTHDGVKCPECRKKHPLLSPGLSISEIPVNSAVLEIINQPEDESENSSRCQVCDENNAQVYCIDCLSGSKYFFCSMCDQHEHNRPFWPVQGHRRYIISTIKYVCSCHSDKQATLFSEKLSEFACEECKRATDWLTRSVMFVPIPDALNKLRFQSQNLSILLLKAKYQLEEPEKLISEQLKHIDTPVIKAKKDILSKFENILYLVEEKKFELRHRVENEGVYRKQQLEEQVEQIQLSSMISRDSYEDLNQLQSGTDAHFLLSYTKVTGKAETLIAIANDNKSLYQPAATEEIPFFISDDMEQQLKTLGTVGGGITPTDLECVAYDKADTNIMQLIWQIPKKPEGVDRVLYFQIEYEHLPGSSMFSYQLDGVYIQREPYIQHVNGNELSTFIDCLCPGYRYQFRIHSANAAGWGMWSKSVIGRCEDFPITIHYTKRKINRIRIPFNGYYRITAKGAKAADGKMHSGGNGAVITATFYLKSGDVLIILCGGMSVVHKFSTGGGGGTFIAVNEINHESLLIAAGGGGGTRGVDENDFDGCDASLEPNGTDGKGKEYGNGGINGGAGEDANTGNYTPCLGYGGAGFLQNSTTASSFLKGGHGGQCGGFGGGGSIGHGQYGGGGGGGGYSGGGGGRGGGGGGSFVQSDGIDVQKVIGNKNNGSVIIRKVPNLYPLKKPMSDCKMLSESGQGNYTISNNSTCKTKLLHGIQENVSELKLLDTHPSITSSEDYNLSHKATMEGKSFQSAYFSEAEKRAHIPFVHHNLLECDHDGLEYTIEHHDITLRIPEGAVAKGEMIHFEIGVALYGPFNFPEKAEPVSPIIWLCVQEKSAILKKPFQLILPYFLTSLTSDRLIHHQIEFAKANHSSYFIAEDEQVIYQFDPCETKPLFASSGYRSYGVLTSTHCCFYCLKANQTPELASDAGYCLARIERPLSSQSNEVYFTAVYLLGTCIQALQEQFPEKDKYRISRYGAFKFKAEKDTELCIRVVLPSEHDQCVIALDPNPAEIRESNINFWNKDFSMMKLQHETQMYPPRVKMTVTLRNPNHVLKLPVKFEGCTSDSQLDTDITFPLGNGLPSPNSSPIGSHPDYCSHTIVAYVQKLYIDDKPKLRDVFKKLLPLASKWRTIGILLGVENHLLKNIKSDEAGVEDCLHTMLSEWLNQLHPPPTWMNLADAVEETDLSVAEKIRQHLATKC